MTVTTTTTTMTPTTKPRFRVRTEPMPAHCFAVPEGAPACYGDVEIRSLKCWLMACAFRSRCGDFAGRVARDASAGTTLSPAGRRRAILPDDAPTILNEHHFASRANYEFALPRTPAEVKLWDHVEDPLHHGVIAATARMAYRGGLIPVHVAVDIAELGEHFHLWLDTVSSRERGGIDPHMGALVWATGEITREALRAQGRPHLFGPKRHHELWEALAFSEFDLTRNALRKRRERVRRYFRRFEWQLRAAYEAWEPVLRWTSQQETQTAADPRRAA